MDKGTAGKNRHKTKQQLLTFASCFNVADNMKMMKVFVIYI